MRPSAPMLLTLSLAACAPALSEQRAYDLVVRVESDPGEGLAKVALEQNKQKLGTTGQDGVARVRLVGREGERATLRAACPATHIEPSEPVTVVLRTYQSAQVPEVAVRCPPRQRKLAVVVKAKNGAHLDVVHRGKVLTTTDDQGVAHILLEGAPGEAFEVNLDTSAHDELKPQNPGTRLVIASRDDAVLFDPELEVEREERSPRRHHRRSTDSGRPTRIR